MQFKLCFEDNYTIKNEEKKTTIDLKKEAADTTFTLDMLSITSWPHILMTYY